MFAHPLMLAWLAVAAVPLVLALAGRTVVRTVDWPAMLFVPGRGSATAAVAGRWRAGLLGLLRTLLLATIVVAVARPRLPAGWSVPVAGGLTATDRTAVAIVVDDAAGTAYAAGGRTRFDAVTGTALAVIERLGRGDRATVIPDPPPMNWVDARPSADLSAAAAAVNALHPTHRPADQADALTRAAAQLADAAGGRQIIVVCDREASAWRNVTDDWARAWRDRRDGQGRPPPRVLVVPVGGDEADNVAIESVRAVDPPLTRDVPGTVRVTVHNWGPDPRAGVPLTVWAGPRTLLETTVSLPPRSTATVDVPARLDRDGPRLISAVVRAPGGLAADHRRDGAVDVLPPPRVLLVVGDEAAARPLRAALAPNAAAGRRPAGDPATVTVVDAPAWSAATTDLAGFDAVVLADPGPVSADRADDLRRFVDDGGGLLVAPGERSTAADWNDAVGDDGVGLLPAVLADPASPARPQPLRPTDGHHPVTRFAATAGGDDARSAVRIDRLFAVVGRPAGTVLLSTADNRPLVVAGEDGGGRVVLSTVPLDGRWTNLPGTPFEVPLVQSAVRWLTADRSPVRTAAADHEVPLGRPIVVTVDGPVDAGSATAALVLSTRPDPMRIGRQVGGRTELRLDRPPGPGSYRVRWRSRGRQGTTFVAVVPPAEASDLAAMSTDRWTAIARRVGLEVCASSSPATVAAAVARGRGGPELWAVAMAAAVALLAAETVLARRWSTAAEARGAVRDG